MSSALPFDELNALSAEKNQRSMPIDRYFDEMVLTEQQKRDRKDFARELQELLFVTMSMIHLLVVDGVSAVTLDTVKTNLTNDRHSTSENPEDLVYWYSQDRARFNAENEANDVFNYDEYRQAIFDGKTRKEWISMRDAHVRKTHAEVDGEVLPIEEPFLVGTSLMRFPKDASLGASDDELIGCRCSARYF